jgi:CTP:molybdopterin cytidylyltransferase MocA
MIAKDSSSSASPSSASAASCSASWSAGGCAVDERRVILCPCCDQPVTTRDHVHPADEAIRMLTAKIAEREAFKNVPLAALGAFNKEARRG